MMGAVGPITTPVRSERPSASTAARAIAADAFPTAITETWLP
jgi:hypothetical protein